MWAINRRPPQEETTLGFWFLSMRKETMQYINCSLTNWTQPNILPRWWEWAARRPPLPTSLKLQRCSTGSPRSGSVNCIFVSNIQMPFKISYSWTLRLIISQFQHLLAFLFAELGTSGAIDGSNQLIMKGLFFTNFDQNFLTFSHTLTVVVFAGRFQQKHIENVLRRYIKEYVTCHTCRYPMVLLGYY